ncbi:MAG TPA: ACT domain-containing protein [Candidatus Acidoferrales bacterium]|nr:ACT domain-containing protein [Candidatus Acidoferrales bacterium]
MPKANQLTVRCENRPGTLAHIAKVMGDRDVNILGFLLTTSGTRGHVKLIVDDVEKAKEALEDAGLSYAEQVVLHARLANVPGALGRLARKLAARKINILSGYQTLEKDSKKASVVLEVSNLGRALRVSRSTASDQLYE